MPIESSILTDRQTDRVNKSVFAEKIKLYDD